MRLAKFLSSVALSCIITSTIASPCFNQYGYVLEGNSELTCEGLSGIDKSSRQQHCNNEEVAASCPVSCEICCKNDSKFRVQVVNKNGAKKKQRCGWIGKKKSRRKTYCEKNHQKAHVKAACPATCGLCPTKTTGEKPPSQPPVTVQPPSEPEDDWSFLVVADWHAAEAFAATPGKKKSYYLEVQAELKYINETFGGDVVLLPGDINGALPGEAGGGKWDNEDFAKKFKPELKDNVNRRIRDAGKNCYGAVRDLFSDAGYGEILVALGDHEIGGNSWGKNNLRKLGALPSFHSTFTKWFDTKHTITGEYLFQKPIGDVPSRPWGTKFERSSYAYQHKSVLFITLDGFKQLDDSFIDRKEGLGGEGVITCTIDGQHLSWLKKILQAAKKENSIRFIVVQSHVPVIQPVRKVACSGQFMDYGEGSAFWKLMVQYGVDIYFAGEVHANTATQDPDSKLIQIVSRGNQFNNFLKIDVTHNTLNVISYNEVGIKRMNNHEHKAHGNLMIDKSQCAAPTSPLSEEPFPDNKRIITGCADTVITSSGALKLLDRTSALLHFDFEEILPLGKREVIGLQHDDHMETRVTQSIDIRGITSKESLPNLGSFDQPYDAQIANVRLVNEGTSRGGYHAEFNSDSRFGIFGNGPHTPGVGISFALWIKYDKYDKHDKHDKYDKAPEEAILVHYGHTFGVTDQSPKDIFTLTIKNGKFNVYTSPDSALQTKKSYDLENEWHHIAVSMPRAGCKLSKVVIYLDGKPVPTAEPRKDKNIFFISSGKVSIGGFGHSNENFEKIYPGLSAYTGSVDDFYMWARPIETDDFLAMGLNDDVEHTVP